MKIYVGGAIDRDLDAVESFSSLISEIQEITGNNVVVFNPSSAFSIGSNVADSTIDSIKYVKTINDFSMLKSDICIFMWADKPSFGVPIEIELCARSNKTFIVLDRSSVTSNYLRIIVADSKGGRIVKDVNGLAEAIVDIVRENEQL
jgi:hypothetical protein